MTITVLNAGPLTTVQDGGRWGYQAYGMPVAGAMDRYALAVTNLLVRNPPEAAVLEMTLKGGVFRFETGAFAAIGGADMGAKLDELPLANWSSFYAPAGSVLAFDFIREGCRAYLSIAGGFDLPIVQGSRSTYLKAGIGGFEGRALKAGDALSAGLAAKAVAAMTLPAQFIPRYGNDIVLRTLLGPLDGLFEPAEINAFFEGSYVVSNEADRMGYRLEGPSIKPRGKADIISDAVCQGAIQIPGQGMPIVMMADRQTTGGYAKIGTVIGPDLFLLAQAKPRDRIRFVRSCDEDAVAALREERARYALIKTLLERNPAC